MTHTPTPWAIDPKYPSEVQTAELQTICSNWHDQCEGREVTLVGIHPASLEESAANAAFIVKAVNAHDKLVEALRGMVSDFDQRISILDRKTDVAEIEAVAKARAVLEGLE